MTFLDNLPQTITGALTWENLETYVVALLIFVFGIIAARLLASGVERLIRRNGSEHGAAVGGKLVFYLLVLAAGFGALTHLGVKLTGLLAAAGIVTVAIGFAAQTSVSNVISGLFLLIDRPFSINDTVKIDQTLGTVVSIDLLSSRVRTFDNLVVRIPNEVLLKSTITNFTLFEVRRIEIPVSVSYNTDLDEAHRVLRDVMRDHSAVLDEPEPAVLTEMLADNGVTLLVRAWVVRTEFVQAKSQLTTAIKNALDEAGIEIPFPQRVVHHVQKSKKPTSGDTKAPAKSTSAVETIES